MKRLVLGLLIGAIAFSAFPVLAQPVVVWRPPMNCSTNDSLKWNGSAWVCTSGPTVTGSGTSNKITKWASASSIGNSQITDDGTTVTLSDLHVDRSTSNSVSPEIDWLGYNGGWFAGIDTSNSPASRDFVVAGLRPVFSCEDAVINGTTTITSAAQCGFSSSLIGKAITGTNIPPGTTISAVAGPTSATLSQAATGSGTIRATITRTFTANDVIYLKHRGGLPTTIGFGVTPPTGSYRLQVSPDDSEVAMGGFSVRVGPSQTGKAFVVNDSSPTDRFWVTSDFYLSGLHAGTGAALGIQAEATNERPLAMVKSDKTRVYAFQYNGNNLQFRYITGGVSVWEVNTSGNMTIPGTLGVTGLLTATAGGTTGNNWTTTGSGDLVSADDLTVGDDATITDALVVNGNTTLGDASSDTITVTGKPTFNALVSVGAHQRVTGTALGNGDLSSCGGGTPTVTGTDVAGRITEGTTATGCVLTFKATYTSAPYCTCSSESNSAGVPDVVSCVATATTLTLTNASASSKVFIFRCIGQSDAT